jgi:hypothetical protein
VPDFEVALRWAVRLPRRSSRDSTKTECFAAEDVKTGLVTEGAEGLLGVDYPPISPGRKEWGGLVKKLGEVE